MDIQMLTRFFMWCTILNMGLLVFSSLILAFSSDFMYRIHGKWFPMPPFPSSSIIWYLPAKVEPVVNSSVGVSSVFVGDEGISSDEGRGVAHSPQNFLVSGLSV